MPFEIVRNDISNMCVDAIVNTANPRPIIGAGTDAAIHAGAGAQLLEARRKIGPIAVGEAALTPAYNLQAKCVIHTVGPVWQGGQQDEVRSLRKCYDTSLQLALKHNCNSVAFPLISSGTYGFPKEIALQVAISAFSEFLLQHEMQIYLVVFDRTAYRLSESLMQKVTAYIDQNYVDSYEDRIYAFALEDRMTRCQKAKAAAPTMSAQAADLKELLRKEDRGFSQTLLQLIDESGKKDSEIYTKANISRQHFSKIRNNPAYRPTKPTVLALAIALELDLNRTRDLLERAGYALSNSSKFDIIVRYFIEQGIFDIMQINATLFEFDQNLLGC